MRINKLLIAICLLVILIGNASAVEKNFVKSGKYGTITVSDKGSEILSITLDKNTDTCLFDCYAKGVVTLNKKSVLFSNYRFNDIKAKKDLSINYTIIVNGNKYKGEELEAGTYSWELYGEKKPHQTIDWILETNGVELTEWFVWGDGTLKAYYTFEGDTLDVATGNNTCYLVNGGSYVTGKIGSAVLLDGSNDYLTCGNHSSLYGMKPMTVAVWVKFSNWTNDLSSIINKEHTGGAIGWELTKRTGNQKINFIAEGAVSFTGNLDTNWHYIVAQHNGTATLLYVDNVLNATVNGAGGFTNTAPDNLTIGVLSFLASAGDSSRFLNGTIDEIGIWNRTLTSSEITELYNGGAGLPYGTGILLTYNASAYETGYEGFTVNISNYTSTVSNPKLIYNTVEYSMTLTGSSGNYILSRSLSMPLVSSPTGYSFYFSWTNSTGVQNSSVYSQTVNPIYFTYCNTTYTSAFTNLTFKDEVTMSNINGTITTSTWSYWLGTGAINKTYSYSNSLTNFSSYSFCFSQPSQTLHHNSRIQYAYTGYQERRFDYIIDLNSTTDNRILYLLSSSDGIYTTFQVLATSEQPLSNVYVIAEELIGATYYNVGAGYTGDDGGVTFWVNPNNVHRFTFSKSGYETQTRSITPTQSQYTVYLSSDVAITNVSDYTRGLRFSILPTITTLYNNTFYLFSFNLTSTYWDIQNFGFTLTNGTSGVILGSNSSTDASNGVTMYMDTGKNNTVFGNFYYTINGTINNFSVSWNVNTVTPGIGYNIRTFILDFKNYTDEGMFGLNEFGRTLIVFFIIFILVGILSYTTGLYSPMAVIWFITGLVILFDFGFGLIPTPMQTAFPHFITILISLIAVVITIWESR